MKKFLFSGILAAALVVGGVGGGNAIACDEPDCSHGGGRGGQNPSMTIVVPVHAGAGAEADASAWQKQSQTQTSVQRTDVDVSNVNNNHLTANGGEGGDATAISKAYGGEGGQGGNAASSASTGPISIDNRQCDLPVAPLPVSAGISGSGRASDYGHQVTSADLKAVVANGWSMNASGYAAFLYGIDKFGSRSWNDIKGEIICKPSFRANFGKLSAQESVLFTGAPRYEVEGRNIVGALLLDSKFDKKYPVVPTDFLGYVYEIAAEMGANRVYILDSFEQLRLKQSSGPVLGGALSAITSCATGGAISLGLGGGKEMSAYGKAGILVILYRETVPVAVSVSPMQVSYAESFVAYCPNPCANNAMLRKGTADNRLRRGDVVGAIENYEIAERDILNGREPDGTRTITIPAAQSLLHAIRYNWSFAIRMQSSEESQMAFARRVRLTVVPELALFPLTESDNEKNEHRRSLSPACHDACGVRCGKRGNCRSAGSNGRKCLHTGFTSACRRVVVGFQPDEGSRHTEGARDGTGEQGTHECSANACKCEQD